MGVYLVCEERDISFIDLSLKTTCSTNLPDFNSFSAVSLRVFLIKLYVFYENVCMSNLKNFFQVKWKVLHFISQVPDQLKGRKIRFLLTPTMNKSIKIQRISSCNGKNNYYLNLI